MKRTLIPLAAAALLAAGCGAAEHAAVDLGSGPRYVREVVDSLGDAGRFPAVVLDDAGTPTIAYFGFPDELAEGEVAAPRPIGSPSVPGILLATVDDAGVWIRGAVVIAATIPGIDVAFNPAIDQEAVDMSAGEATGLAMVRAADGTLHIAWGTSKGLWIAKGSSDPASATQWTVEQVYSSPPQGLSLALDGTGQPIVSFVSGGEALVASARTKGWGTESLGAALACGVGPCATAAAVVDGAPTVVFTGPGGELDVATRAAGGWTTGASLVIGAMPGIGVGTGGAYVSFYADASVAVAPLTGGALGTAVAVAAVDAATATAPGAGTSIAVDSLGELTVAWFDASDGAVSLARGTLDGGLVELSSGTPLPAASPSVSALGDPTVAAVAWYDPVNRDLLLGRYGTLEGLAFAVASPVATPKPAPSGTVAPTIPADCVDAVGGAVTIVSVGVAFTDGNCIRVVAGEPFTITFDNQDPAAQVGQHNIAIFPSANDLANPLFRGDLVSGPATVDYAVPALDAGQYFYHCDVHPQMTGIVVAEGPGGGGGGGGAADGGGGTNAPTARVTAMGVLFDTAELFLPAGQEFTLTLDNQDAQVPHNIAIFPSASDLANPLFRGELITGPSTIDYLIPALEAGTYYFHCDVHPNMNGTVTVA